MVSGHSECVGFNVISGTIFTGQMTKPTVSKHWRKPAGRRDQAWIPPEPLHHVTIIQLWTTASTHSVRVPMWQTPFVWPARTAHITVLRTVNIQIKSNQIYFPVAGNNNTQYKNKSIHLRIWHSLLKQWMVRQADTNTIPHHHTIQHRAVLIIFLLNLQTITITRMCLVEERGHLHDIYQERDRERERERERVLRSRGGGKSHRSATRPKCTLGWSAFN